MRRLAVATVSAAALILAACSDESRQSLEPNADQPALVTAPAPIPCPPPRFPLVSITNQIIRVFPAGPLRLEAFAREAIIAVLWSKCRPARAQEAVASFVGFTLRNFQAKKIGAGKPTTSTPQAVSDIIDAMLVAVGLTPADLPLATVTPGTDFGTGFADGISPGRVVVRTNSGAASGSFQGNAWGEPTVVTIFRLPNSPQLVTEGENQFAPFYDYDASNRSDNHIVVNGELFVGFCLEEGVAYPANIAIGHNPVQTNQGNPSGLPPFEILDPLTQAEYNGLGLTVCATLQNPAPPPPVGLNFGEGLPAFASSAWLTATHYLGPLAANILPERVQAAVPRNSGAGGRTSSYSPFGVVEPVERDLVIVSGDEQSGFANQPLTNPLVVRVMRGGEPVEGALVTFNAASGGSIAPSPVTTGPDGEAEALWTLGPATGTQTAIASTPGAASETLSATAQTPPPARIVLQWGTTPSDLDAHLTGPIPDVGRFHVFFANPCHPVDPDLGCQAADVTLDRDDQDGTGPETITIAQTAVGTYRFSVHDFTNRLSTGSSALSASGALVRLFLEDGTTQVFQVPTGAEGPLPGTLWTVFELDFNNETPISTIGTLSFTSAVSGEPFLRVGPSRPAGNDAAVIGESARKERK
jgi:hypothetical protein